MWHYFFKSSSSFLLISANCKIVMIDLLWSALWGVIVFINKTVRVMDVPGENYFFHYLSCFSLKLRRSHDCNWDGEWTAISPTACLRNARHRHRPPLYYRASEIKTVNKKTVNNNYKISKQFLFSLPYVSFSLTFVIFIDKLCIVLG